MQTLPNLPSPTAKYRLIEVFMPWADNPPDQWPINHDRAWIVYCLATAKVVGDTFFNEQRAALWFDQLNTPNAYPDDFLSDQE
ncbi:MAG: hypothetical protein E6R09_05700 [Rhodocyclaceae bacterium]|nr:MAG: hypothetical protein E6R09_05700 [Rhodocyclaceae bacterium]